MSFVQVGSGSVIQPANLSYAALNLTANTTLQWPFQSNGANVPVALFMYVTGVATTGLVVTLPQANIVSVGTTIIFKNTGSNAFNVVSNNSTAVGTVPVGKAIYIILQDNSTTYGTWNTTDLGSGTSSAQAANLAGQGLLPLGTLLNVNSPVFDETAPFTLNPFFRGQVVKWTGGTNTLTLPAPDVGSGIGNGYYAIIINASSIGGLLSLTTANGALINGQSSIQLTPGQSAVPVLDGTNWITYGNSVPSTQSTISVLSIPVTETSMTLSLPTGNMFIITFTGTPVSSPTITVPNLVAIYYIKNSTNQTITLKDAGINTFTMAVNGTWIFTQTGANNTLTPYPPPD